MAEGKVKISLLIYLLCNQFSLQETVYVYMNDMFFSLETTTLLESRDYPEQFSPLRNSRKYIWCSEENKVLMLS